MSESHSPFSPLMLGLVACLVLILTEGTSATVLYMTDIQNDNVLSFDPLSPPTPALVGSYTGSTEIQGLAYDPINGIMYGVDTGTDRLVTINTATGATTPVGTGLGFSDNVFGLAFDANANTLYASTIAGADQLYQIDPASGTGTPVGGIGFNNVNGLAFDPDGGSAGILYGIVDGDTDHLISIDLATGAGTSLHQLTDFDIWEGLAYDPTTGELLAMINSQRRLFSIDPATGTISDLGTYTFSPTPSARGLALIAPVPEPSSLMLVAFGLLGVVWWRRRTRPADAA